jgi:glycosyltransferase involved in cell wall biosynthesis
LSHHDVGQRIAIVDPGSFVLPYDFQLVRALAERGDHVDFHGSTTRYNGEFLDAMRQLPNVTVHARAISGSVASRWRGLLSYAALLLDLLSNARRYTFVNLQFSAFWPFDLLAAMALEHRFVYTVHNAVPHGFTRLRHRPTLWLASRAARLVFVSEATRADFMRRYGDSFEAKASVLPHGLSPIAPTLGLTPYEPAEKPEALVFWSTVKPYKGVELFAALASSEAVRQRGLALEIHGAWDAGLRPLRAQLMQLGVAVQDAYVDERQLLALLGRNVVFLLPYEQASQSGALYALLNHGCLFICSDVGDLGAFMRRFGLDGLLLRDRSAEAVLECLDHLAANGAAVIDSLARAQQALHWDRLLAEHGAAYAAGYATE